MIVDLRASPTDVDATDLSAETIHNLQMISSVLAIRKLDFALRLKQPDVNITFPRQQNRRFSYCVKSPSLTDDFIFYSNILPVDIEHFPFAITVRAMRATYRNVPIGPNYTHFELYNTLKAVDKDQKTCWQPLGKVRKGDFFAIDFLRIQTNIVFILIFGHTRKLQSTLDVRISFDGVWWISYRLVNGISIDTNKVPAERFHRLIVDSRQFPPELQTFRYITFNATNDFNEAFQICDIQIIKNQVANIS